MSEEGRGDECRMVLGAGREENVPCLIVAVATLWLLLWHAVKTVW